jgi:predicted Zn-ribbon and HTH transcriptional regulator
MAKAISPRTAVSIVHSTRVEKYKRLDRTLELVAEQFERKPKTTMVVKPTCPKCLVPLLVSDTEQSCPKCGMGKLLKGRR